MKPGLSIIRMARNYWNSLILAIIGLVLSTLLGLITPDIVRRLTAHLSDGTLTSQTLITLSAILVGAYLLRAAGRFLGMYFSHVAAWSFVGDIIAMVYDKFQSLSMRYYNDKQTGQLMSRMVNDTRMLEVLIAHSVPDLLSNLMVIAGVAVMIFIINPTLALITLIPVPFVLVLSFLFSKKIAPLFRYNQEVLGELSGLLQDHLSGIKEIQAFGRENTEKKRIAEFCRHYANVNIRANFANGIFHPTVEFLTSIGTVIVVGIGGLLAMGGKMDVSDVVGFFMYLSLFYQPLMSLARLVEDVQNALAGGVRVLEVLEEPIDINDIPEAGKLGRVKGHIAFENISFSYQSDEKVLNAISFTAKPGEMIALVGPTGVGKTTILSLLERFYDPSEGTIRLDGYDIKTLSLSSLRANISMVLQDVFLFNGTVEENISYGLINATHEQVVRAAKAAQAHTFIMQMPDGYNTVIGERGTRLSGGQKQRIAIARAVLRDAPILLLDEATSAIDAETEADIQHAIEKLSGNRTVIVIAHRLSTIKKADRILVIDKGSIVQSGKHEELLEQKGLYSHLYQMNSIID